MVASPPPVIAFAAACSPHPWFYYFSILVHRSRKQEEITRCVENCSIPLSNAQQKFDNEMAQFQERLQRALMVCQDKYEAAKMQKKPGAMNDMVSCADQSIQDGIKMLPLLADKLKASLSVRDNSS
ncbi:hypothetical protein K1719_036472 [Acacia pycnantha]|nr:hypothetical protein K1719_036472 [Acacia pycnantha]